MVKPMLNVSEACHRLAPIEGQKENKTRKRGSKRMKAKFEVILMFAILTSLLFSLPQQTLADEDVRYVYPTIETNCDRINATAYRFRPSNYLNLTFTFTISEPVYAYYYRNITLYQNVNGNGRLYDNLWVDGPQSGEGYIYVGTGEGYGYMRGHIQLGFDEAGEHTAEISYVFITYGDTEGFYQMNFLLEPRLMLERKNTPMSTLPFLISGVTGGGIAFAISAVVWHKKNSAKKEKNDVNP